MVFVSSKEGGSEREGNCERGREGGGGGGREAYEWGMGQKNASLFLLQ